MTLALMMQKKGNICGNLFEVKSHIDWTKWLYRKCGLMISGFHNLSFSTNFFSIGSETLLGLIFDEPGSKYRNCYGENVCVSQLKSWSSRKYLKECTIPFYMANNRPEHFFWVASRRISS